VRPDLVLLGDTDALDECRAAHGDVPVIVIGEPQSDAVDRVRALDRGCDDFLVRPFDYEELLARIRAVLRRTMPAGHETMQAGPITADLATRCVRVDGHPIALAGKEYELLVKLMSDPTRVFTKESLLRDVWGFRSLGRTRTLDSHASRLRRKLSSVGPGAFVINVWGVGYRLLDG
jgi:DNA-binding response OmpR family regulator